MSIFPWLFDQDMEQVRKDLVELQNTRKVPVSIPAEVEHDLMDRVAVEEGLKKRRTDDELVRLHGERLLLVLQDNLNVPLREVLEWEESLQGFDKTRIDRDFFPDVPQEVIDSAFVYIDWLKERGCETRAKLLLEALEWVEDSCYSRLRSVHRGSPLRQELRNKATAIGARLDAILPDTRSDK